MSRLVEAEVRKRLNEYIYNADSFDIKGEWVYLNDAQVQRPVARWCSHASCAAHARAAASQVKPALAGVVIRRFNLPQFELRYGFLRQGRIKIPWCGALPTRARCGCTPLSAVDPARACAGRR